MMRTADSVLSIDVSLQMPFGLGGVQGRERVCYETLWMDDRAIDGATSGSSTNHPERHETPCPGLNERLALLSPIETELPVCLYHARNGGDWDDPPMHPEHASMSE